MFSHTERKKIDILFCTQIIDKLRENLNEKIKQDKTKQIKRNLNLNKFQNFLCRLSSRIHFKIHFHIDWTIIVATHANTLSIPFNLDDFIKWIIFSEIWSPIIIYYDDYLLLFANLNLKLFTKLFSYSQIRIYHFFHFFM